MVVLVKMESMSTHVAVLPNTVANFARLNQWCWDNKCTHKPLLANITTVNTESVLPHLEVMVTCANVHQDIQVIIYLDVIKMYGWQFYMRIFWYHEPYFIISTYFRKEM